MFTFKKISSNGNNEKVFKLKEADISINKLSILFDINKSDLFLTDDDNTVIWANEDGMFANLQTYMDYYVNGHPNNSKITPLNQITNTRALNTLGLPAPINRLSQGFGSSTQTQMRNNITKATCSGSFNKKLYAASVKNNRITITETVPLKLNDRTSNIEDVKRILFNSNENKYSNIAILDSAFLEVNHSSLTSGTDFWKGTRKFYIINRDEHNAYLEHKEKLDNIRNTNIKRKRSKNDLYDEDDDDIEWDSDQIDESDFSYSPIVSNNNNKVNEISAELLELKTHVLAIKDIVNSRQITTDSTANQKDKKVISNRVPLLLKQLIQQFNCTICLDLCKDDIPETTRCCRTMVCVSCVQEWKNQSDSCPHCREPEPQTIAIRHHGMCDIMQIIRSMKNELED